MKQKKVKIPAEHSSTSLGVVNGVNLQLTDQNTLFVTYLGRTSFPYLLSGYLVKFDEEGFEVPRAALDRIREILRAKEQVRKAHAEDFDEEDFKRAFTYS